MKTTIIFKDHAVPRMLERNISEDEIIQLIEHGECIETYDDDRPYPGRLLFKMLNNRPLHAVVAKTNSDHTQMVITAYIADSIIFTDDFRTRR